MQRATPVEMRICLEAVEIMKKAGLKFVPIPVFNNQDHIEKIKLMQSSFNVIIRELEKQNDPT